jgi:hypothetical protein
MDPAAAALELIATQGILGAVCVVLFIATAKLYAGIAELQRQRVSDAQKVTATLMTIQKEHTEIVSRMAGVVGNLKESIERLESSLR